MEEAPSTAHLLISQTERIKRYGIECIGPAGDGIFFRAGTWRPGGEYVQKLILRNVSNKVKKFKYKLPSTRYFSLAYPEEIILSPGIFKEIDVIFRPVEYEPYDDTIYIKMLDGISGNGFHVSVRATIDKLMLIAPEGLDLGYCTTHQITTISFQLTNVGEISAPYEWEVPEPFMISPAEGTVPVGESHEIVVRIRPEDASVFVAQAVCHVGRGVHAIIPNPVVTTKLSAIAKYAHISLSESFVTFGEVVSGTIPESQEVLLQNTSVVPAEFSLVRFDADRDEVFDIYPKSGVILPRSEISVLVNYHALAMGCFSLDRYSFRTPGNCDAILTCKGLTMPPKVTLCKDLSLIRAKHVPGATATSSTAIDATAGGGDGGSLTGGSMSLYNEGAPEFSLNFRDVEVGRVETRILHLRNDSNRDTAFSIIGDTNGIFKMSPKQGIIPALFKQYPVKVIFKPPRPCNYYRRFFVLVGDALPLFYDCLGTGFIRAKGQIKEQRPAPLRHAHVQAYRNRCVAGAGGLSPDELDSMFEHDVTAPSNFFAQAGRIGTRAMSVTSLQRPITRTGEAARTLVAPAHEFFISDKDASSKEVVVDRTTLDFDFTPHNKVSAPKMVTIFNNTRSKVVVQWEIPVVDGVSAKDVQLAESSRDKDIITEDRAHRELYQLQAFEVNPSTADLNPGDSQTFEIAFCPKQTNRNYTSELEAYVYFKNQRTFRLVNDHSLTPPWCLTVRGIGHTFRTGQLLAKPSIVGGCVRSGKLVFPCCFEGESIYETFMVRNTSNLPCTFHIELGWDGLATGGGGTTRNGGGDTLFSVKPSVGEIAANDFVLVCARFTPQTSRKYVQLLRLFVNGDMGGKLLLEGTGAIPYLILPDLKPQHQEGEPPLPEEAVLGVPNRPPQFIPKGPQGKFFLKPTCVGLSTTRVFHLKNASRLPLRYRVSLNSDAVGVCTVSPTSGLLKGNEETGLTLTFAPKKAAPYEFKLTISVFPIGGKSKPVLDANQPGPAAAPELLQTMSVQILGEGDNTALVFDPPRITADVRLVNTSETHAIYLENVSESDLSYRLLYKEEFEPDAASLNPERTISEVMALQSQDSFGLNSVEEIDEIVAKNEALSAAAGNAESGQGGTDVPALLKTEHSLFCAQPKGKLPARSRTRIVFTYNPRKAGLFEFLIYAQIRALDASTGEPVLLSNDEAALLRVTQPGGDYGNNNNNNNEAAPASLDDTFDAESFAMLPLMSNITARAAFPKLLFEDIRAESDLQISDVDALWTRFSLSQINYDLSIPMTHQEVLLNETSTADVKDFSWYKFEFSPGVLSSPEQSICIQLRNNGYLTTSFHLHLPNEKHLELEAWCDEEEPSEELNRLVCIIEELKLFTIEPRHGTLQPGECCTLRVSYHHTSLKYEGLHNLPVQMLLSQGKQFYLNLTGRTLPQPHIGNPMYRKRSAATAITAGLNGTSGAAPQTPSVASQAPSTAQRHADMLYKEMLAISQLSDFLLVLVCPDATSTVRFLPVPTGLNPDLAPLQRTEIINVSGVSVSYEVDMDPIEALNAVNYHLPLVRLVNPSGIIPAHESVFLEWYFYPLEASTYNIPLKITYISAAPILDRSASAGDVPAGMAGGTARKMSTGAMSATSRGGGSRAGTAASRYSSAAATAAAGPPPITLVPPTPQTIEAIIQATGYDPREAKPVLLESYYVGGLPPVYPLLTLPNQKVTLSQDLVDFNYIPQHCSAKRIVFLKNSSTTSAYEFVVDESSCVLCIDGLLAVHPLIGRVPVGGSVPLEFTFSAMAQPMAFLERIKLMIREVIRGKEGKRSSVREALMKKIATKKAPSTPHESIVARPTYSRSAQLELNPVPEGRRAALPCTISETGAIVTNATNLHVTGGGSADGFGNQSFLEGGDSIDYSGTLDNSFRGGAGGGTRRAGGQRVLEMDVVGDRSSTAHRNRSVNVGFVQTPSGERGALGSSGTRLATSDTGVLSSRGGLMSRGDTSYSGASRASGRESAPLLGVPTALTIRLRGDVFPIQTIRDVVERNKEVKVLDQYVVPETLEFIPPVGKKFFDQEFVHEQKLIQCKSRVNITFVKGRDEELRETTQIIADALFRAVLNTSSVREYTKATLSEVNPTAVDIPHSSVHSELASALPQDCDPTESLPLASSTRYGVYFSELQPPRSLLSRLIIELKHLGFRDYYRNYKKMHAMSRPTTSTDAAAGVGAGRGGAGELAGQGSVGSLLQFHIDDEKTPTEIDSCVPMQWVGFGDDTLVNDEPTFTMKLSHVKKAMRMLGIVRQDMPKMFDNFMECVLSASHEMPIVDGAEIEGVDRLGTYDPFDDASDEEGGGGGGGGAFPSRKASFMEERHQSLRGVTIAVLVRQLPEDALALLDVKVAALFDARRRRRKVERNIKATCFSATSAGASSSAGTTGEVVAVTEPHTGSVTNVRGSIADTIGELAAAAEHVKENLLHMQEEEERLDDVEAGVEETKDAPAADPSDDCGRGEGSMTNRTILNAQLQDKLGQGQAQEQKQGQGQATKAVGLEKQTREPLRASDLALRNPGFLACAAAVMGEMLFDLMQESAAEASPAGAAAAAAAASVSTN